jgi:hypothetical protein
MIKNDFFIFFLKAGVWGRQPPRKNKIKKRGFGGGS